MDGKAHVLSFHAYLYNNLVSVLADLSDEQLAYSAPLIDERSLREVALHAYRPLLAVVCVACGEPWPPRVPVPATKEGFLTLLQSMRVQIEQLLELIHEDALDRTISLPWDEKQTVIDAFNQSIGHGMLHVGQIYGIRAWGGFPLPAEQPKPQRGNV